MNAQVYISLEAFQELFAALPLEARFIDGAMAGQGLLNLSLMTLGGRLLVIMPQPDNEVVGVFKAMNISDESLGVDKLKVKEG